MKFTYYLLFIYSFTLFACQQSESSWGEQEVLGKPASWIPRDTIHVDYNGILELMNYNERRNTYICRDFFEGKVIEIHATGEIMGIFDLYGSAPAKVGVRISSVSYDEDTTFVVLSERGYHFYESSGRFIRKISHPPNISLGSIDITGLVFSFNKGTESYVGGKIWTNADKYHGGMKAFYDSVYHISVTQINNLQTKNYIQYEASSIYHNDDHCFFAANSCYFGMSTDQKLYKICEGEPILYAYNAKEDFLPTDQIHTNPLFLDQPLIKIPYGQQPNEKQQAQARSLGKYTGLQALRGDTVLLTYRTGIPASKITNQTTNKDINDSLYVYNKNYCQIFASDKKLCDDIKFPSGTIALSYAHSLSRFVFATDVNALAEEPEGTVFYVYSLEIEN